MDRDSVRDGGRPAGSGQRAAGHPAAGTVRCVVHALPGIRSDVGDHDRTIARRSPRQPPAHDDSPAGGHRLVADVSGSKGLT